MIKYKFLSKKKIWIAGHNGMVGSALHKKLRKLNLNLLTASKSILDLRNQSDVDNWIKEKKPNIIFLAAAKVGGILENSNYPADFIIDNLKIQTNVISSAFRHNVKKMLFLGSACIYPVSDKPIKESELLTGKLESTNQAYSVAKIAGIEMCRSLAKQHNVEYISVQPNNLYGPNDNFSINSSHVIPALIKKISIAKEKNKEFCEIWGSGKPRREFLYVDDLAEALILISEKYKNLEPINVGSGFEISISSLANKIKKIIGFKGRLLFNTKYPDGVKRKFLDSSKIKKLGWTPKTSFDDGLRKTIKWFEKNQ